VCVRETVCVCVRETVCVCVREQEGIGERESKRERKNLVRERVCE